MGNEWDSLGGYSLPPNTDHKVLDISNFSINGSSKKMRQQILDDVFVMEGIAILGQWTVIYAAPNTGKTLLSLHLLIDAINKEYVEAGNIYYINVDDTFRGLTEKTEIAETVGFHMIAQNHNGFHPNMLPDIMQSMIDSGSARGKVIVLDTLKKFVSLMDKSKSTKFGEIARPFTTAGGTIIALAHTNKHKDAEGRSVHAGTTDIKDDSDCVYIADVANKDDLTSTIILVNDKNRGNVESEVGFRYSTTKEESYTSLLASVEKIDNNTIKSERQHRSRKELAEKNRIAINEVIACLRGGINKRTELAKEIKGRTGIPLRSVYNVIDTHTGINRENYQFWSYSTVQHNAQVYKLNPETNQLGANV